MAEAISLYELNAMVRGVMENSMRETYWVQGELLEGRENVSSGHFYGELCQKDERTNAIIARAKINIWVQRYRLLSEGFVRATGRELAKGMKVLVQVRPTFHESYGYALNVLDIDPTYTLGDIAQRRQQILRQLEEDGILHDNQTLRLSTVIKHIAVISSPTAAGYGDFCRQLENNEWGFEFDVELFPAVMQGQHTAESIIAALEQMQVSTPIGGWGICVIIRGGGATSDLSDFDSYPLAACIAQCPVPVLVGIGHERDETVLDFVAHTHVKTPTAAAAFIIDHQLETYTRLCDLAERIGQAVVRRLEVESQRVKRHEVYFPLAFARLKERCLSRMDMLMQRLGYITTQRIVTQRHRLELVEEHLKGLDPKLLLKRGYSITMCGGKVVRSVDDIIIGEVMTTKVENGEILSKAIGRL